VQKDGVDIEDREAITPIDRLRRGSAVAVAPRERDDYRIEPAPREDRKALWARLSRR